MTSLANKALLVSLNLSQWTARKYDRAESAEVAAKHGAADGVARVNKHLLPGADSLRKIFLLAGTIRTDYYKLTLPWLDGMGILKADGYLGFTQIMSRHKTVWDRYVSSFLADYPLLRAEAQMALNGLYHTDDYPHPDDVAQKFRMDVSFYPVPDAADWRVQLSEEETDKIRRQIEEKVMESQGRAMKEAWGRIYDLVSRAHKQLSNPDTGVRNSLLDNARELCRLLPSLNIADDPNLEHMRNEVERHLCDYDVDDLRRNPSVKADVADKMKDIMARMGPFMGAY